MSWYIEKLFKPYAIPSVNLEIGFKERGYNLAVTSYESLITPKTQAHSEKIKAFYKHRAKDIDLFLGEVEDLLQARDDFLRKWHSFSDGSTRQAIGIIYPRHQQGC